MYSSRWSMLSAVAACAVVATLSQSWFMKSLLSNPVNVKIIPDPVMGRNPRKQDQDDPDPELLPDDPSENVDAKSVVPPPPPPRHSRVEQIWDEEVYEYVDYIPRPPRDVPDDNKLLHWFIVYSRRTTHSRDEKPEVSVEFHSRSLINFLRTTYGGESAFNTHPLIKIHELFPLQDTFSDWLRRLEFSELQKIDLESKKQIAHSVGIQDAFDDDDEPILIKHFDLLSKQLHELITCLSKEFQPMHAEIDTYLSHGHITFPLLGYMYKPGAKLLMRDDLTGDKIAVKMESTRYIVTDAEGRKKFVLQGTGRKWNGTDYNTVLYARSTWDWKGTRSITSLPWAELNEEDEQELTERGRTANTPVSSMYTRLVICFIFIRTDKGPLGGIGRAMVDAQNHGKIQSGNRRVVDDDGNGAENDLPIEELCFLPPTLPGFMLSTKKWVTMRVLCLEPVKFDANAWDHLVLDPDTKHLVRSLVDVTCKGIGGSLIQDVITGKGGGLVSVLHGKPGTGKTLTAEAVAEHLERPIYILAARWDAVLLIDEADVFLEQRSMHEIQRNAVVSVALRLLEYHSGVLFLTTNRIKSFDEAFLSRFSIGIKYPDLDRASRLKIWRSFLTLANVEVVENKEDLTKSTKDGKSRVFVEDLDTLAERSFNGRSIKNLVRTSQALALANNEILSIDHLWIVVRTSERFLHDFEEIGSNSA